MRFPGCIGFDSAGRIGAGRSLGGALTETGRSARLPQPFVGTQEPESMRACGVAGEACPGGRLTGRHRPVGFRRA
jgi:hypothetical protein